MIDILKDIVKHTHGLGFLDLVKITGNSDETAIDSMAEDRSVILQGSFHKPQAEMSGTFGMPQMGKLDIHLKCPEYKDCLLYTSPSPRDTEVSRMPSSA